MWGRLQLPHLPGCSSLILIHHDSESDTEIPKRHVSPTTSTLEIPTAHILPAPSVVVAPSSEFLLHLALTTKKSVRPLPSYRLALRSASLSTMYPPTTSKSSAGDSSSESSVGPSRKRYIEADATADEVLVDRDVEAEVDAGIGMEVDVGVDVEDEVEDEVESSDRGTMEVGVDVVAGIDIPDGMLMPDAVERLEQIEEGLQDIYDHVIEIPLQSIEDIKTGQKELEARSLIASLERSNARL
ncbi:hypothetical protein Tco_0648738 [Tanacetum coccineum]